MSNRKRLLPLQRRLDFLAGLYCPWCEEMLQHHPSHLHAQGRVVAIELGWLEEESSPDKQEASNPARSEASTDRVPMQRTHGGCSTERK